jgi:hypothetical protein
VSGFGVAARRAREGGLDGVEVSMAHGYLAAQFFAPASNRRDDEDAVAPLASKRVGAHHAALGSYRMWLTMWNVQAPTPSVNPGSPFSRLVLG